MVVDDTNEVRCCELKNGHAGAHRDTDYDDRTEVFIIAEWLNEMLD
jgi:hypothetical protein